MPALSQHFAPLASLTRSRRTCRHVDTSTGAKRPLVSGHPAGVCSIAPPPSVEASSVATTCQDGVLRVWRTQASASDPQAGSHTALFPIDTRIRAIQWLSRLPGIHQGFFF